ncbi:hypothetical protein FHS00_001571 [Limimaricola variabilis]|uniref:Type II secretion system (T2SS), protein M subtype b n=1 Tax=Limimaricola variabilis TaxID=1492771 RepID=A0ABR6HNH4_9RHOB|nr:GspMb/PilO family protein [Limimaricola variabilis]MBB3711995.1 hypothetical protein [Limimaricola variabilis]
MRWIGALVGLGLMFLAGATLAHGLSRIGVARQVALEAEAARLRQQVGELQSRIAFWQAAGAALVPPEGIAHRSPDETSSTLAVQKALFELGAEAGLTLSTIGAAPPPAGFSQPVVAVELEARGPIGAVATYLAGLEAVEPRLAVSQMVIRAAPRGFEAAQRMSQVTMRLVVWGFWVSTAEEL